jgi:hypothetical protein
MLVQDMGHFFDSQGSLNERSRIPSTRYQKRSVGDVAVGLKG